MFLKIDGAVMPAPIEYTVSIQDISKGGRTADATMHIERIATKRKIELNLKMLSPEEVSRVLKAIKPVMFEVEYIDPEENGPKVGIFYSGDRTVKGLKFVRGKMEWDTLGFNLIER